MKRDEKPRRRIRRWILPTLCFLAAAWLAGVLWGKLRDEVWAYYTDDEGVRVEVGEPNTRFVLWEDPRQNLFEEKAPKAGEEDVVNRPTGRLEAAFSADGTMMVLVRWNEANADMYLSRWNGRLWSRPAPIRDINTPANERGPAFSRDGRHLYFASDREGGRGGYDLYAARWDGAKWTGVAALGETVNTPAGEFGPCLSPDGLSLYFSSDRNAAGAEDIFVARRIVEPGQQPDAVPVFAEAEPVGRLNSASDDVQAALTARGSHVYIASDRDRTEEAGFQVYVSRVVGGEMRPPERVDLYIDRGDVTDPAVRMEGFDLLFSGAQKAAKPGEADPRFTLYRTTTREVYGYTDYSRWELFKKKMRDLALWILLAIAALIALIYILERWKDITNLFHKCLAGSALFHLLILLLMMIWFISKEMGSPEPESPEVAVSIDALAQEQLALESEPEQVQIADTQAAVASDKMDRDFEIPNFTPRESTKAPPVVTRTSKESLVESVQDSKESEAAAEAEQKPLESPLLNELPTTLLPEPDQPVLDDAKLQEMEQQPADQEADKFKPTPYIAKVKAPKKEAEKAESEAVTKPAEAEEVERGKVASAAKDTGGELVAPHRGLDLEGNPPELAGKDDAVTTLTNLGGQDSQSNPMLPGKLSVPDSKVDGKALTPFRYRAAGKPSTEVIEGLGGSKETEIAIGRGLEWLTRNQEPDGRWDIAKHGGKRAGDMAGTGLALLCYYGWGIKHGDQGAHQETMKKAIDWILANQKADGDLRGKSDMYAHGIATMTLCEGYGLTKDERLKVAAEKAIGFTLRSQSKTQGGWRYKPGNDSDTSVTGWQYMSIHSARMAGLQIPDEHFKRVGGWLDKVGGGQHGGIYGYSSRGSTRPAMVATGMFCRQLDMEAPTKPRMQESAGYLAAHEFNAGSPDYYYVYYGTLALYQHQGREWEVWNERMKESLLTLQHKAGELEGSWDKGSGHGSQGGRVLSTTMAILSLEVYYRLLPMYGFRAK